MTHETFPYPHPGGCADCREALRCNYCGGSIAAPTGRCTNGRCLTCHAQICAPGGTTSEGHGFSRGDITNTRRNRWD